MNNLPLNYEFYLINHLGRVKNTPLFNYGATVVVLRMVTEAEEGFSHACNRFVVFAEVKIRPLLGGRRRGSATSLGGMSWVHAALGRTGKRPYTWPERVVTVIAGAGGLNGN